jgi:hypothetical protein
MLGEDAADATPRYVFFFSANPDSYGAYDERKSNIFKIGDKIIAYVEPVGYTWAANPDGNI